MSQGVLLEADSKREFASGIGLAFLALSLGHFFIDALSTLLPASLGLIEVRAGLTPEQSAWLIGLGSLTSGLAQPLCAVMSDRFRTRIMTVVGILLAGFGFAAIGFTETSTLLGLAYIAGMIGNGVFHPIAATTVAQMYKHRRNSAASIHFVAGMVGGVVGAMIFPRWLSTSYGFETLPYIALPAILLAIFVYRCQSLLPAVQIHSKQSLDLSVIKNNWKSVWYLYVSSALRYCVNTALVYLFVRWAQDNVAAEHTNWSLEHVAKSAAPTVGNLNAAMILGMAMGGIFAGRFVHANRERMPMILVPLVFSPVVALLPLMPVKLAYVCAAMAGVGFSAMIPISIALAQHLLPHRANLASSLMMGGAWTVATIGPRSAEFAVTHWGINTAFLLTAGVLAVSGIVCTGLAVHNQENQGAKPD